MNIRFTHVLRHCMLLLVLSLTISGIAPSFAANAVPTSPVPVTRVATVSATPGSVFFTGTGFSPGEPVYIALYDSWGTRLLETRWITSSPPFYGPNGSFDPATGYYQGGSITETFANLCGIDAMIRAYDQHTTTWSTWHEINADLTHCSN